MTRICVDSEADDLLNEIPPWEALDDDSDLEEDLCNMVRRLSDQFMLDFVASPAEPLSDEAVRNLSLQSPRMLLSPFDCQQNLSLMSPPVGLHLSDSEADDLLNEIPPWEALDDDSDLEEDLCNMVRRLSDQFMLDFVASPAEPLSDEAVRNLSLQSPRMLLSPFDCQQNLSLMSPPSPRMLLSPFDCQQNLSLMSPPVGLHLSGFLSSPDFVRENEKTPEIDTRKQPGVPETKILTPAEQVATGAIKKTITPIGAIKKTVTPRVPTKPLCLITNSPAVSKLPTRLASRLLQPRNYHKGKENE
ncbi:hypothetical protein B566_EDAN009875 [Ephemera danica]|nr:hypothetical protein B566_EDAN009875 [Ephemera danica]